MANPSLIWRNGWHWDYYINPDPRPTPQSAFVARQQAMRAVLGVDDPGKLMSEIWEERFADIMSDPYNFPITGRWKEKDEMKANTKVNNIYNDKTLRVERKSQPFGTVGFEMTWNKGYGETIRVGEGNFSIQDALDVASVISGLPPLDPPEYRTSGSLQGQVVATSEYGGRDVYILISGPLDGSTADKIFVEPGHGNYRISLSADQAMKLAAELNRRAAFILKRQTKGDKKTTSTYTLEVEVDDTGISREGLVASLNSLNSVKSVK